MGSDTALEGKAALVTAGGTGIGLGIAKRLAADGALVTICARRESVLAEAAKQIGHDARYAVCDVTDDAQVKAAVEAAAEPLGRLDIAVANAGGSATAGPLALADIDGWNGTLALSLTGTLSVVKHAAPWMGRGGGGSIVAVSSIAGHLTHRNLGAYCVAKAGVEMLVRNSADELGRYGIRVNAVRPGIVPTEMAAALHDTDVVREDYLAQMPLGRVGTPEDVGEAVRFLAGPESSWITGQLLGVDGGHSLRRGPDLDGLFAALFDPQMDALMGRAGTGTE